MQAKILLWGQGMKGKLQKGWEEDMERILSKSSIYRDESRFAINCYMDGNKLFSRYIMTHMAKNAGDNGYLYKAAEISELYRGVSVAFGKGCIHPVTKPSLESGQHLVYIDHAYFNRGYRWKKEHTGPPSSFRMVLNEIHPTKIKRRKSDRFEAFNISLKPWKKTGDHILVCPPTGFLTEVINLRPDWSEWAVRTIRENSDRKIIIRPKPGISLIEPYINLSKKIKDVEVLLNTKDRPIEDDLYRCWAVVAPASAVSIEAIINGVPVFTEPSSPAAPIAVYDLTKIEEPIFPDREPLLYNLAYSQFTLPEIESGYALEFLIRDNREVFMELKNERKKEKARRKSRSLDK
jgi:hypothetical protein